MHVLRLALVAAAVATVAVVAASSVCAVPPPPMTEVLEAVWTGEWPVLAGTARQELQVWVGPASVNAARMMVTAMRTQCNPEAPFAQCWPTVTWVYTMGHTQFGPSSHRQWEALVAAVPYYCRNRSYVNEGPMTVAQCAAYLRMFIRVAKHVQGQ
jgi:hypothetical protein